MRAVTLIALLSLLLGGCAATPGGTGSSPMELPDSDPVSALLSSGQYLAAAQMLERQGDESDDPAVQLAVWRRAADATISGRSAADLLRLIGKMDALSSSSEDRWRLRLLQAHWHLLRQEPLLALGRVQADQAPFASIQTRWLTAEVTAMALAQLQDGVAAVQTLVDAGGSLPAEIEAQRIALLQHLVLSHELYWLEPGVRLSSKTRGWLELGAIGRRLWATETELLEAFSSWQRRYPSHPGQLVTADLTGQALGSFREAPRHVALLLPLSGRLQAPAEAIRDGFLAAYYQAGEQRLRLSIIDTEAQAPSTAFDAAVAQGADLIVGPLTKAAVAQTIQHNSFGLPQVALNTLPPGLQNPTVLSLALPPEDDAVAAAYHAIAQGHQRVVALAIDEPWAQRSVEAFAKTLGEQGGVLLDHVRFEAKTDSYPKAIQQAMQLERSRDRAQRLSQTLGTTLEYELKRRQDAQALYLVAHLNDARQIRPQIRFFHAADLPVYSSGRLFDGDLTRQERDLNDIQFCSSPWLLGSTEAWQSLRSEFATLQTEADKKWARFHALGLDAYALATQARAGGWADGLTISGASGELRISQGLQRRLPCAQFRDGLPQLVSRP